MLGAPLLAEHKPRPFASTLVSNWRKCDLAAKWGSNTLNNEGTRGNPGRCAGLVRRFDAPIAMATVILHICTFLQRNGES